MKRIYWILLLILLLPGTGIILYSTIKSNDAFTENLIKSLNKQLEKELSTYLQPIRTEFNRISGNFVGEWDSLKMSEDSLSAFLIPTIARNPAIGSLMLYNDRGYNFFIYRERNSYVSSLEKGFYEAVGLEWSRRNIDNTVSSKWTEILNRNPGEQVVLKEVLDQIAYDKETVLWTAIYRSEKLNEPVITAAIDWPSESDTSTYICTFNLPIRLIVRHLNKFNSYSNRRIFMAMESGQLIDIPAEVPDSTESFYREHKKGLKNMIQDSLLLDFIGSWKELGGELDMTFFQEIEGENWWVHIRDFEDYEEISALGMAVSESSIKMGLVRDNSRIITAVVLFVISLVIFLIARSKRKSRTGRTDDETAAQKSPRTPAQSMDTESGTHEPGLTTTGMPSAEAAWKELIAGGENKHTEFKSALRMDMNLGKVNPKLELVIMKSIAAFSNADGGMLLIGVADNGEILGLEHDYSSLKRPDADFYEIHLRNLLNSHFGVAFITTNLEIEFPVIDEREICAISVEKGSEPAYITTVDKNGNKTERFYVRSGNSSQEIQSLKEMTDYIGKRFS